MQFEILLFAGAAQLAGKRQVTLEVSERPTLGEVAEALRAAHPQLSTMLASSRWAVDRQFAPLSAKLAGGEEIAFIPPVSGG